MNSAPQAPRLAEAEGDLHEDELGLAVPPPELREGDVIGRFRVGPVTGVGGHGVVYSGEHVELGFPVAVKVMDRYAGRDPRRRARFRREAIVGAQPRHRNIAAILETGVLTDGSPYLVMEHVAGVELATLLDRGGPLPAAAAIDLGLQLLAAVSALAEHGIVHRDIKPQNVMLARAADGAVEVKLLDFGIVKGGIVKGVPSPRGSTLTQDGFVLGTPQYMSPEQIRGQSLDPRSDLYAVGALLYEAMTGQPPIDREDLDDVLSAMLVEEPRAIRACPPELDRVIARALEKSREARFPTPGAMAEALREAQRALALPHCAAAWESVLPELARARAAASRRAGVPARSHLAALASAELALRCLPTPAERPSALRARRARPRLPPPWWPAAAVVVAAVLVAWALASLESAPRAPEPPALAAPSPGP